ncbi:MAG: 4-(cytidine 5'-diphospho)-2-C-methyl-D-erythritol kinase [Gammaproteobacteria bacterium]|nr:4-(cytidine 5'-diphospho)-2-C-methyl-D-erythritol kinase [Gammaproteobacteria bacterium]
MTATPGETRWPAPAKLNLFLHITGRRDNGRHNLQTLFQLLDYGDEISIVAHRRGDVRVACADAPEIACDDNLALKAALLLKAETEAPGGADITIAKRIPVGAGLGGGSSDAATVLLALNRLWGCRLALVDLLRLAARLGADVPVFVNGRSAWAEGAGNHLRPVHLPRRWYAVLAPAAPLSTREMFQAPDLRRDFPRVTMRDYRNGGTVNAFQEIAARRRPEIAQGLAWLDGRGVGAARLTGSGSAFFAAFDGKRGAEEAVRGNPAGLGGFVARGVAESPLHRCLREAADEAAPDGLHEDTDEATPAGLHEAADKAAPADLREAADKPAPAGPPEAADKPAPAGPPEAADKPAPACLHEKGGEAL